MSGKRLCGGAERLASEGCDVLCGASCISSTDPAGHRRNETILAGGMTHVILTVQCGLALLHTPYEGEFHFVGRVSHEYATIPRWSRRVPRRDPDLIAA